MKFGFLSLREECRSRVYEVKILRRTLECKREKEANGWKNSVIKCLIFIIFTRYWKGYQFLVTGTTTTLYAINLNERDHVKHLDVGYIRG